MKKITALLTVFTMMFFVYAKMADKGYSVGDYAQDFTLTSIDGKTISMADYPNAKGFVVVFTCNNCPYAKAYEDRINQINMDYALQGYPVIAINPNSSVVSSESLEEMKKRADEKNFTFPYLADETQEITRAYGATNTPHVYVLDKESEGKYRVAYIGTIDNNYKDAGKADKHYIKDALDALMKNHSVPETSTKAIGCTIKWKEA